MTGLPGSLFMSQADTRGQAYLPTSYRWGRSGRHPRAGAGPAGVTAAGRCGAGGCRGSLWSTPPCSCRRRGPDTARWCCLAGCPGRPPSLPRLRPLLTLQPRACAPPPPLSWEDTVPPGRTVAAASGVVAALGSSRQPEEGGSLGRLHVTGVKARPQGTWGPPTPSHAAGEGQGLAGLATQSRGMGASPVQGARPGL